MQHRAALVGRNAVALAAISLASAAFAIPEGLLFHVSFDKLTTQADFAAGDGASTFTESLELRPAEGIKGAGLLQRQGERCAYNIKGNLDTARGSFSAWVKPLSWAPEDRKFRHFLATYGTEGHRMLLYIYPIGDLALLNYVNVGAKTPDEATWRAGCPTDVLTRGEWTHIVSTWDATSVRLYANGKRVGEGIVGSPTPAHEDGQFAIFPVEFWKHAKWSDPDEQTICDEVRVFDHALSDDEVLDLYAEEVPGGLEGLEPKLAVSMTPGYSAKTITLTARAAHLDEAWEARLDDDATFELVLAAPDGQPIFAWKGEPWEEPQTAQVPEWLEGEYRATAMLSAGDAKLSTEAILTKPATPWLPQETDWRADRLLPPWTALEATDSGVKYWNGEMTVPGALPSQITAAGEPLLAAPITLSASSRAAFSSPTVTEALPHRVSWTSEGTLGDIAVTCQTLVEFDGLIRADITLTPPANGAKLAALDLEIPIRDEVATYYRNPKCQDWDGGAIAEDTFLPYGWLGNEERGLSWFMESPANWRIGEGKPAISITPQGDAVVVRLRLISQETTLPGPVTYTIGFEPTPVRPPDPRLYTSFMAGGPQVQGSNLFVYGWMHQISYLNGRLIAHDPADQRRLVDRWRESGKESLSYSCTQCTANLSPEFQFFGPEWNLPYGASFSGYKRVPDEAPYSMVGVCTRSSFADFLVWCARENIRNDWSGGIYTDIDGAIACDNKLHGCGFTDAFGRTGRTWPLYAHRSVSRRIYAACRDAGKRYFSHAHSDWYSVFNAFNDGWCPGEQFSSAVLDKPNFYMDDIPDRVWRTEFYTPTTGVPTFLLPQLGRLAGKDAIQERGSSECCFAAAMCYGAPLWAGSINQEVVVEVWAAQQAFGMEGVSFIPFWKQQEFISANRKVRLSLWQKPGARLLVLTNFTDEDQRAEIRLKTPCPDAKFSPAWMADALATDGETMTLSIPAKRGALVTVTGLPK